MYGGCICYTEHGHKLRSFERGKPQFVPVGSIALPEEVAIGIGDDAVFQLTSISTAARVQRQFHRDDALVRFVRILDASLGNSDDSRQITRGRNKIAQGISPVRFCVRAVSELV